MCKKAHTMNTQKNLFRLLAILMAAIVMSCQTDDAETPLPLIDNGSGSGLVAKYTVSGNSILLKENGNHPSAFYSNTTNHDAFWGFFSNLIPSDMRPELTELVLFADQEDGTAAYVSPLSDNDLSKWEMGYNLAYVWTSDRQINKSETAYTSIHEYAHILTLNNGQVTVSGGGCDRFFTGEGCSNTGSYINDFYNNYWSDIYTENQRIDQNDDNGFFAFYEKYRDRFVSEYAATNPGEDIAESFTMFVIKDRPSGNSVADQKVKFFYNYQELVSMRSRIRAKIDFEFDLSGVSEARSERFSFKNHDHGKQEF